VRAFQEIMGFWHLANNAHFCMHAFSFLCCALLPAVGAVCTPHVHVLSQSELRQLNQLFAAVASGEHLKAGIARLVM
jgi:hypothetical protein